MKIAIGHIRNELASGVLYEQPYWTENQQNLKTGIRSFEGTCYKASPGGTFVELSDMFPGVAGRAIVTNAQSDETGRAWYAFASTGPVEFSADCGLVMHEQELAECR